MSEAPKPDGGTVERFRVVVLPHLDAAYGFARWLTRDPVLAQDLAQEAMLRALRYFHAFRGEEARPWLLRIVRNTWSDLRARNGATDRPLEEVENWPAEDPDPEQSALGGRPAAPGRGGAGGPAGRSARDPGAARDRGSFLQAHRGGARPAGRHRHVAPGAGPREAGGRTRRPRGKERSWTARPVRRWSTPMSTANCRRPKVPSSSGRSQPVPAAGSG